MASNLKVIIDNAQTKQKIPSGIRMLVRRSCHATLQYEQYDSQATINVVFSDNEMMSQFESLRASNFEAPELIAIPSENDGEDLGKIIISIERVMELMSFYHQPFEMGIVYASVHGVLNLLGQFYTDRIAKELQMEKEAVVMAQLGFAPMSGVDLQAEY